MLEDEVGEVEMDREGEAGRRQGGGEVEGEVGIAVPGLTRWDWGTPRPEYAAMRDKGGLVE